jgi:hypothetical protein
MSNKLFSTTVSKLGTKLGIYINDKNFTGVGLSAGDMSLINLMKDEREYTYLARFARVLTLKKEAIKTLNLNYKDTINFKIKKVDSLPRKISIFNKSKIDILALIPKETTKLNPIIVTEFIEKEESMLRIWSFHSRGSCTPLILKRFLDIDHFGRLLGQLQSEGTKANTERLEFANNSLYEHKDFINYLIEMGLPKDRIKVRCQHHPDISPTDKVKEFENKTGIKIYKIYSSEKNRYSLGFHTYVQSMLLCEIIINAMNYIRKMIVTHKLRSELKLLSDAFLAKILSGDGTVEIDMRHRNLPQARLRIVDGNNEYLNDYAEILKKYGLNPKITQKYWYVRAYLRKENAEELVRIGAFENNPNHIKLLKFIESREESTSPAL